MKANELRLGNYVLDRGGKILRIDQWGIGKVEQRMLIEGNKVHPLTEDFEYIKPIPLTEEWLVKFGFDISNGDFGSTATKGVLEIACQGIPFSLMHSTYVDIHGAEIRANNILPKHVHQLQNLYFALTGEELELVETTPHRRG